MGKIIISVFLLLALSLYAVATTDAVEFFNREEYQEVSLKKGKIAYWQKGSGKDLLLIHGFGASGFSFRNNIDDLAKHFRVWVIDLIGFGLSEKPQESSVYSHLNQAKTILEFMDYHKIKTTHLVGHSMGGRIAWFIKAFYPERVNQVVLLGSVLSAQGREISGFFITVGAYLIKQKWVWRSLLRGQVANPAMVNEEMIDGYRYPFTQGDVASWLKVMGNVPIEELPPIGSENVFALIGEKDKLTIESEAILDNLDVAIYLMPKCGHLLHEEKPEVINKLIINLLSK